MADKGRRYLFTGGGTAGHVLPNLAVWDELRHREPDARFLYLGSRRGYESRLSESGIRFRPIATAPFCSPRRPLRFARMTLRILCGVFQVLGILIRYRPHVVVATGGYVSVPVVLASWIARRRIYLHEQNVHPGMANRLLAHLATSVGVSFPETVSGFRGGKARHVGYPVRSQIAAGRAERAREQFRFDADRKVALIFGGSMGSRSINRGTVESLKSLLEDDGIAVIHVTGLARNAEYDAWGDTRARLRNLGLAEEIPGRYVCKPFIKDIQDVYAMADLVVARAGAGTVMEFATVGKPSILIPKSDAPGNHQLLNALSLQKTGASEVLFEELFEENGSSIARVRGDALAKKIRDLLDERDGLERMGRQARRLVVDDALAVNASIVQRLASGEPMVEKVLESDRVGFLMDPKGRSQELLFRSNIVGNGLFADIRVRGADRTTRAVILRTRNKGSSEFHVYPKKGLVEVNGKSIRERTRLDPEDRINFSGKRRTFTVQEREIERTVRTEGVGARVVVTGLGTLASRVFGLVREACTAAVLGLSSATDILTAGLTVSNFFRGVFAEMAVDTAFLPTYVHLQRTGRREAANRLFGSILALTLICTVAVAGAAILTMPLWLPFVVPGFAARGIIDEAVTITSIMFPYLVLISVAALLSAVLRAFDRFAVPAFSSLMFSVGVIGGILFYPAFGLPALAWGVLAGGLGQVLFQLPTLLSPEVRGTSGLSLRPRLDLGDQGVRKVARVTPNIVADVSIQKFGSVVDKILASSLAAGMMGALHFSMVIFRLPYGLISQSINTVLLKEISDSQAVKDRDSSRRLLAGGLNWTLFTLLPVSVGMIVLAEPTVRLLLEYASFTPADTANVAWALRLYALGLVGWGVTGLCGRFFSARLEQPKATLTSLVGLATNVALSVTFIQVGMGIGGLALGTSLSFLLIAGLRMLMLGHSLRAEGVPLKASDIVPSLTHTVLATAGSAVAISVVYAAVKDFDGLPLFLNRLFVFGVPLLFGVFAYAAMALMIGSEQVEDVMIRLGRRRGQRSAAPAAAVPVNPYCLQPDRLIAWVDNRPGAHLQYNFARRVKVFLQSREWKIRNIGVKLVGKLRLKSFRYDLCQLVLNREPAPWSQRILGGDFKEPGFIRRNAVEALRQLDDCEPRVEHALMEALYDPYFETRAAAARTIAHFADRLQLREETCQRLIEVSKDRNFEVAGAAVAALGKVAQDDGVVPCFQALHYHRNWMVRNQVILAYRALHERGIITDKQRILALLDDVLATTEGFRPTFPLKEDLHDLQRDLLGDQTPEDDA